MIEIIWDTHTHTVHSHGKGTVEENVVAAIERGFTKIVISDHGMGHRCYNIKDVDAYLKDIRQIRDRYAEQIEVLAGVELNLLSLEGDVDLPLELKDAFDIRLMGFHKFARFKGFSNAMHFLLPKSKSAKAVAKNTQAYKNALDRYPIDIITHIGYGLPVDIVEVARYAAQKGTCIEVNAKHPEFTPQELKECAKTGVMFSVGSDAHSIARIGDFAMALEKIDEAGISASQVLNAKKEE
ncbi:MAG: PHP domain-containing protein [Christensenella sp.]|nr:PHP domain-containing protein [Christensenella sp.]